MAITVKPVLPVLPAQQVGAAATATPELVLQPGTTIDATVLKILAADLVRIAIAALSIDVKTEIPLEQGQALKLAVSQTENGIRLTNITSGNAGDIAPDAVTLSPDALLDAPKAPAASVPAKPVLTPLEKATVIIAAQTAATEQGSQAPLFANLVSVVNSPALPPKLLQAMREVLAQQTGLDHNLKAADIKSAFEKSGLFLEASLAAGTVPTSGSAPDLKAALLVLRQTLQTVLGGQSAEPTPLLKGQAAPTLAPTAAQELEPQEILLPQARVPVAEDIGEAIISIRTGFAGVLKDTTAGTVAFNILQEAAPDAAPGAKAAAAALRTMQGEEVHTSTPPPPFRGALPSAQPVSQPSIAPETPLAPAAQHLLADTDAAIARQTLLQVASLPDRIDALPQPAHNNDPAAPRWNFEIPFATPQGTAMAQFEISRDGGGNGVEATKKVWRARFTLDAEPSGPVHALVALVGEKTAVRMWAERPATAERLRAGSAELAHALARAELKPGDIVIRDGTPPQPQTTLAGHFLDRAL